MRLRLVSTLVIVGLIGLVCGVWTLNNALAREYLWWATGIFRPVPTVDYSSGPPLPLVEAGGVKIQVVRGTASWWGLSGGLEGDMFMTPPQLARFQQLRTHCTAIGTEVKIEFPEPTSSIVLSRWKYGNEVEREIQAEGSPVRAVARF